MLPEAAIMATAPSMATPMKMVSIARNKWRKLEASPTPPLKRAASRAMVGVSPMSIN